jgi:hypothetical protein
MAEMYILYMSKFRASVDSQTLKTFKVKQTTFLLDPRLHKERLLYNYS